MSVYSFMAENETRFHVRFVPRGGLIYTRSGERVQASAHTVEFYDARYINHPAAHGHPLGQYTGGSYYATTLLDSVARHEAYGLSLYGGVDAWTVDAASMVKVIAWIEGKVLETLTECRICHLIGWHKMDCPKRADFFA